MKNVELTYKRLPHPYAHEASSKNEVWCEISFSVVDVATNVRQAILATQWNVLEPVSWFVSNKSKLISEALPIEVIDGSIAKSLYFFYERYEPDEDLQNTIDKIYEYRTGHDWVFAFCGMRNISKILFGVVDDVFTISRFDDEEQWCYEIDASNFFKQVDDAYNDLGRPDAYL